MFYYVVSCFAINLNTVGRIIINVTHFSLLSRHLAEFVGGTGQRTRGIGLQPHDLDLS